ncbi:MAG: hypothetical protein H7321_01520 [Bacteroidia bacterium]|nr:hypothetical protein [Bacteroidia bacterium]
MEKLKIAFNNFKPHLFAIITFITMAFFYFLPNFQGKVHREEDVRQGQLKGTELRNYEEKEGHIPSWTNAIFSGMPSTMVLGQPSKNQVAMYNYLTPFGKTEYPFRILLLSFIGFYILLVAFKIKPTMAVFGALAYGFATYSISSIEAAHYTKVLAMALMPAVLAGLHLLFEKKYFAGFVVMAFNFTLQTYFFHYQITYYTLIVLVIFGIYYAIRAIQTKDFKTLGIASALAITGVMLGVGANIDKIKTVGNFAKETMRGGSAMDVKNGKGATGLKRDYAFSFSYGIGESMTMLIPGLYGGSQSEKVSKNSALYEKYEDDAILDNGWPLYHGELQIISGPIYIGAILIFLFFIGLLVIKNPIKWPILIVTIISMMLAWGGHFGILNNFLFDNLPYYNKFRTPMMALSIAQVTIPLLAIMGLKEVLEKRNSYIEILKDIKIVYYILGGFILVIALIGPGIIGHTGKGDPEIADQLKKALPGFSMQTIYDDRDSLMRWDSIRSLFFISAAFFLLIYWIKGKIKTMYVYVGIGALAVLDVMLVDTRYLSWSDFHEKEDLSVEATPADDEIRKDTDIHYRVFDVSQNNDPFNNNRGAAFHKLVGGYDPAKLSRYQEFINGIIQNNETRFMALNMLNCKYAIVADEKGNLIPQPIPGNFGNAWFVNDIQTTGSAVEEMELLKKTNARITAVIDVKSPYNDKNPVPANFTPDDSLSSIKLIKYHPDTMLYVANANGPKYAVFSEIYFPGWKAYVNGKEMDPQKVDYTLRGLAIPAGNSTIKFVFPKQVENSLGTVVLISSLITLAALLAYIILSIQKAQPVITEPKKIK